MSSDSVKVAVRVRPFNQREKNANSKCVISMSGKTTVIRHPDTGEEKTFAFDHSYWSHDGFKVNGNGVNVTESEFTKYADQQSVFSDLGQGVLDNAWQGYNAALFAYGQTGSGKSYSMIGYGANKGIVPITCEQLFSAIEKNKEKNKQLQVSFSMLEIYNEHVKDLLVNAKQQAGGLKVRQHPKSGFYVDGLKIVPVRNYKDIEKMMEQGNVNRTTASTNMNATSSRSHMVITIRFKQVFLNDFGQSTTKTSEISLVDLAGSERADATGATGDRLKEGSAINQSLSTLGNVISALADIASGKKKVVVPYRNSVLTKLLQGALGGNSKTIMIAALSPADINYDETVSTLRYADRAKKIQNKAVINESPTERLIRELKEENSKLMQQLSRISLGKGVGTEDVEHLLKENERQMSEINLNWEHRLQEARRDWERTNKGSHGENQGQWKSSPHIMNVNEDTQLSGIIKHCFKAGTQSIGKTGGHGVDIQLRGLGLQPQHAVIRNSGKKLTIEPSSNQAAIIVNGKHVIKAICLKHLDRIKFGSNTLYLYIGFPGERRQEDDIALYDYDYFQTELAEGSSSFKGELTPRGGNQGSQTSLHDHGATHLVFQEYISLLPKIHEANAMSEDMKKGVVFEPIVKNLASHDSQGHQKERELSVKVTNKHTKQVWIWNKAKFINRKYLIEDMYCMWADGGDVTVDKNSDPFWDPLDDIFLGSCHVWLQSLAYRIEIDDHVSVLNYRGDEEASLQVQIKPCQPDGRYLSEDDMVFDPGDLLNKRVDYALVISKCMGIKWVREENIRGVYAKFSFFDSPKVFRTKTFWETASTDLNFKKRFTLDPVTADFLNYLQTCAIVIELWGTQPGGDSADLISSLSSDQGYAGSSYTSSEDDQGEAEAELLKMNSDNLKKENMLLKHKIEKMRESMDMMKMKRRTSQQGLAEQPSARTRRISQEHHPHAERPTGPVRRLSQSSNHCRVSMDADIAKALKIFFRDIRPVQVKVKDLKGLGSSGKSMFQDDLAAIDDGLDSSVGALKNSMSEIIRKIKEASNGANN
ncbi:kinesin-like protein KIF28P [Lineus longissimus]|uniref:kinesin-like protein KIF28P n=1 Tax=Lineus longissimus TaxID=88925 RepID=UPI00315CEFB0